MPKKILFLGGKEIGYHCLRYLQENKSELDVEVVAVAAGGRMLFEPELSIEQYCHKEEIPFYTSLAALGHIDSVDFIISVQYHEILKAHHIQKARHIAINLHMAPLPEYRGCNQFTFALLDDAKTFGTTLHQLEPGIDSGAILFEKRFDIPEKCWVLDLYQLTYQHSIDLFQSRIASILKGDYTKTAQADLIAERGTSYHFRNEINTVKVVDKNWPDEKIDRHLRATWFPPFEAPHYFEGGKKVYLSPDR